MTLDGMSEREKLIREGFAFDSERDCDAARYLIGVIDVIRGDRELGRRCTMCKHEPRDGEPDKDCICGGSRTIEGQIAGLNACINHWRDMHANVLAAAKRRDVEREGLREELRAARQERDNFKRHWEESEKEAFELREQLREDRIARAEAALREG